MRERTRPVANPAVKKFMNVDQNMPYDVAIQDKAEQGRRIICAFPNNIRPEDLELLWQG